MSKPVLLRKAAEEDVEAAVRWYAAEAGNEVARRFVAAARAAFNELGRHPSMGSPRYAHELDLPGVSSWPLKSFPYVVFYRDSVVFYRDSGETVDVWRVLHAHRDIPASFDQEA